MFSIFITIVKVEAFFLLFSQNRCDGSIGVFQIFSENENQILYEINKLNKDHKLMVKCGINPLKK